MISDLQRQKIKKKIFCRLFLQRVNDVFITDKLTDQDMIN